MESSTEAEGLYMDWKENDVSLETTWHTLPAERQTSLHAGRLFTLTMNSEARNMRQSRLKIGSLILVKQSFKAAYEYDSNDEHGVMHM